MAFNLPILNQHSKQNINLAERKGGSEMRRAIIKFTVFACAILMLNCVAWADKPQDVIRMSNGYPSGAHFNLIVHGKKGDFNCPSTEGGNAVFVEDYGNSTIEYISNKKASLTELTVLDACTEGLDDDAAQVQLPYDEYYVFARLHGTPKNKNGAPSSVLLTPNPVLQVCMQDPENPDPFEDYTECDDTTLMVLGMITVNGVFYATDHPVERYDTNKKGKGPNKAMEITDLFTWTGYVCAASLDLNGDGVIDVNDVPSDLDDNGVIDAVDLTLFLNQSCDLYQNEWVFNVADLVVESMDYNNSGAKTLQIRFYPRSTTTFESNVPAPTTPAQ